MGGVGSGGQNRKSPEAHLLQNTWRADRHPSPSSYAPAPVTSAERRRLLAGLPPSARRLAVDMLAQYGDWDPAGLEALRSYVLSRARIAALEANPSADPRDLHRELRAALLLWKAMHLEKAR